MNPPRDPSLPFFAYGIFKPGELGYHQLAAFVRHWDHPCSIRGELRVRDGLPLIDPSLSDSHVEGALLCFRPEHARMAYARIAEFEPERLYSWGEGETPRGMANYLIGQFPRRGSVPAPSSRWSGKDDPLFVEALEVVEKVAAAHADARSDLTHFFHLQMAYLLLWAAIERYASLRYGFMKRVANRIAPIHEEPAFKAGLLEHAQEGRSVYRSDEPKTVYDLKPDDPEQSRRYYYQIRCNITHRGKAAIGDFHMLRASLTELLPIFRGMLKAAYDEAYPGDLDVS